MTAKKTVESLIAKGLLADDSHGRFGTEPFTVVIPTELCGDCSNGSGLAACHDESSHSGVTHGERQDRSCERSARAA